METKNDTIIRIALLGPESTAKSTLTEQLAAHYNTTCVKECARAYLQTIHRHYVMDDILKIAELQLEEEAIQSEMANAKIFIDTELINLKVWSLDVYKTCPQYITDSIQTHPYHFYLLTYPDLPWEPDPLRENPGRREFFFNWYEKELKELNANYAIIKGSGKERLKNCINVIDHFFNSGKK